MPEALKLGKDAKLYRQTSGTRAAWPATGAAPNLSEVDNVLEGLNWNPNVSETDVTTRASGSWKQTVRILKDVEVTFKMLDNGDADVAVLLAAWRATTTVAMAVLGGESDTGGEQGLWADWDVSMAKGEPIDGVQTWDVSLKPGYSAVAPDFITVGS